MKGTSIEDHLKGRLSQIEDDLKGRLPQNLQFNFVLQLECGSAQLVFKLISNNQAAHMLTNPSQSTSPILQYFNHSNCPLTGLIIFNENV